MDKGKRSNDTAVRRRREPAGDPVSVLNLFATVAVDKWVAFSRMADGQAILLSAECD